MAATGDLFIEQRESDMLAAEERKERLATLSTVDNECKLFDSWSNYDRLWDYAN